MVLSEQLPQDYLIALDLILKIAPNFTGFVGVIFPDFVASYGLNHYKISIKALEQLTTYSSSEFAIRAFLRNYPKQTLKQMETWSLNKNEHVRRLASEGLRPSLPWSFKLTDDLNYPGVSKKILTNLNNDKSLYVRKSVGNHLNDLTKKHSNFVIDLIYSWESNQQHTSWIIKKGLRTLIKEGDKQVFKFLGYPKPTNIEVNDLKINKTEILIGDESSFSFELENQSGKTIPLLIDYIVHYMKKSGKTNPKVFKLKGMEVGNQDKVQIRKKINFKQLSTRKHYKDQHFIEILINGEVKASIGFKLI